MTVTRDTLATTLFEQLGLNKREADDMVDRFFEEIAAGLEGGDFVVNASTPERRGPDADGVPASAGRALFARRQDPACPQIPRLARCPVLPDSKRSHGPPVDARVARRGISRRARTIAGGRPLHDGSDSMFRGLAAFSNVEVRLFNPFCCARQSIGGKYLASIFDIRRLNHRMHNKLFIADGAIAVMGGRNVADEYFTRSPTNNFVDMDVLVVGPVVHQLASIFDGYWNIPQAYSVDAIVGGSADRDEVLKAFSHLVGDGEQMRSLVFSPRAEPHAYPT